MIDINYWKTFVLFMNAELCMETFGFRTSSCEMMDLLILSISRMDMNMSARGVQRALSLLRRVDSCLLNLEHPLQTGAVGVVASPCLICPHLLLLLSGIISRKLPTRCFSRHHQSNQ